MNRLTAALCKRIGFSIAVHPVPERFRRGLEVGNAVFCRVDRIHVRQTIWEATGDQAGLSCDGRMNAEVSGALTFQDLQSVPRQMGPGTFLAAPTGSYYLPLATSTANTCGGPNRFERKTIHLPSGVNWQFGSRR